MPLPDENEEVDELDDELELEQNPSGDDDSDDEDDLDDSPNPSGNQLSQQQIVDLATRAALAQQPRQQEHQMTPEELDAKLQRFKVTEDHIAKVFDPETPPAVKMKLLQDMLDGAARHAVTSSQVLMNGALSPIQAQQQQYEAYVREQKLSKLTKHVETKFPALAGKKQVIKDSINALIASGYSPPGGSKSALQKEVAKVAQQRIRQVDPTFSLKASNTQRQASSFGSRRGSGQPANNSAASPAAKSFLDHLT